MSNLIFSAYYKEENAEIATSYFLQIKNIKRESPKVYDYLVKSLLWFNSETHNSKDVKYRQRLWSMEALEQLKQNLRKGQDYKRGLNHDHTIPQKIIKSELKELNQNAKFSEVVKIFEKASVAVVLTSEENRQLRELFTERNPFDKYKKNGIEIMDVSRSPYKHLIEWDSDSWKADLKKALWNRER